MASDDVEIARKMLDAYGRGDLQATLEFLAAGCEFYPSGAFIDTQPVYHGHAGWVEFWERFRAAWDSIVVGVERVEEFDGRVLVLGTFRGVGSESGVEVNLESAWHVAVRDSLIREIRSFATWAEALEAAELAD